MKILDQPPKPHSRSIAKVAILTGLSQPVSNHLSTDQVALMDALPIPKEWKVYRNFPYIELEKITDANHLISASFENIKQFVYSHGKQYRYRARKHWDSILGSTENLFLITGSCGIQLANSIPYRKFPNHRIEVLALGPVSLKASPFPVTTVSGDRDHLSNFFRFTRNHILQNTKHMDYWNHPEVREIASHWLQSRTLKLLEQAVIFPKGN
ncbi:MAG: hypothetical protein AAF623_16150 [Planctomycetota bacterium]